MALESAEQIITKMLATKIETQAFWGVDPAAIGSANTVTAQDMINAAKRIFPGKLSGNYNSRWQRIEHKLCRMKYKNSKQWLYAYRWMRETHPHVQIQIYTSDRSKYDMIKEVIMNPAVNKVTLSDTMEEKVKRYFKLAIFSGLG